MAVRRSSTRTRWKPSRVFMGPESCPGSSVKSTWSSSGRSSPWATHPMEPPDSAWGSSEYRFASWAKSAPPLSRRWRSSINARAFSSGRASVTRMRRCEARTRSPVFTTSGWPSSSLATSWGLTEMVERTLASMSRSTMSCWRICSFSPSLVKADWVSAAVNASSESNFSRIFSKRSSMASASMVMFSRFASCRISRCSMRWRSIIWWTSAARGVLAALGGCVSSSSLTREVTSASVMTSSLTTATMRFAVSAAADPDGPSASHAPASIPIAGRQALFHSAFRIPHSALRCNRPLFIALPPPRRAMSRRQAPRSLEYGRPPRGAAGSRGRSRPR